jgi:hypothetical protein
MYTRNAFFVTTYLRVGDPPGLEPPQHSRLQADAPTVFRRLLGERHEKNGASLKAAATPTGDGPQRDQHLKLRSFITRTSGQNYPSVYTPNNHKDKNDREVEMIR